MLKQILDYCHGIIILLKREASNNNLYKKMNSFKFKLFGIPSWWIFYSEKNNA